MKQKKQHVIKNRHLNENHNNTLKKTPKRAFFSPQQAVKILATPSVRGYIYSVS